MISELQFVQGAIDKKELIPTLSHFKIEHHTIRSYNGILALCCPINLDLNCSPKAVPFVKAIKNCKDTVNMSMTKTGRLSIRSGAFKAYIECIEKETAHVLPEGERFDIDGESLITALKTVLPFVGGSTTQPWAEGILLRNQCAYATNNAAAIQYWTGIDFPKICNIPKMAAKELIRIGEPPEYAQSTDNSISFRYSNGRWIRTALLNIQWPDIDKILDNPNNAVVINNELFDALTTIKPFVDNQNRVYISNGLISSTILEGEGASYELDNFPYEGVYYLPVLNLLKGVATSIDFSAYPKPCIFYGDNIRGAIMGLKI